MTYLRIRNFWDYQNADAWKKAERNKGGHRHPAWCKLVVHRDMQLDLQPPLVRLLFLELLRLATVYANAIPNESGAIFKTISIEPQAGREALDALLKGGWIQETKTGRRSRMLSRDSRETFSPRVEESREEKNVLSSSNGYVDAEPADLKSGDFGNLSDERFFEVTKLLQAVRGADANSWQIVEAYAAKIPPSVLADIADRARGKDIGWAVSALKAEAKGRAPA